MKVLAGKLITKNLIVDGDKLIYDENHNGVMQEMTLKNDLIGTNVSVHELVLINMRDKTYMIKKDDVTKYFDTSTSKLVKRISKNLLIDKWYLVSVDSLFDNDVAVRLYKKEFNVDDQTVLFNKVLSKFLSGVPMSIDKSSAQLVSCLDSLNKGDATWKKFMNIVESLGLTVEMTIRDDSREVSSTYFNGDLSEAVESAVVKIPKKIISGKAEDNTSLEKNLGRDEFKIDVPDGDIDIEVREDL